MLSHALLLAAAASGGCPPVPEAKLMSLEYSAFDTSSGASAWRTLLNRGCVDSAIATLNRYREANSGGMTSGQKGELNFHIGQALAKSGRNGESIPHFEAAATPGSAAEWIAYVEAHLGFVRKDRAQLERALAQYERIAIPGSMRLAFIRGFLKCLDRPYMEAAHCGNVTTANRAREP